jgi:hypothetical protein
METRSLGSSPHLKTKAMNAGAISAQSREACDGTSDRRHLKPEGRERNLPSPAA